MTTDLVLTGRQIVVRDWKIEDETALAFWMQPERAWRDFDGPYYPRPTPESCERTMDAFRRAVAADERPEPRLVLAIANRADDALIGRVSRYWQSEETNWMSIGIAVFDPAHWGRGIGLEALGLWGQYLFDALPEIPRLDLRTWSGNVRMMRLAERLGYRQEACFRDARRVDGVLYDALGYGVLRAEWHALHGDRWSDSSEPEDTPRV